MLYVPFKTLKEQLYNKKIIIKQICVLTREKDTVTLLCIGHGDSQLVNVVDLIPNRHGALMRVVAWQQPDDAQLTEPAEDLEYVVRLATEKGLRRSTLPVRREIERHF